MASRASTTAAEPGAPGGPGVVLFDGVCNFCNRSINSIMDRDPGHAFRFAALQSPAGQRLLREYGAPPEARGLDSVVLIEDGQVFTHSDAAMRIAAKLRGFLPRLAAVGRIIPRPLRDAAYSLVARNRYRLLGQREACRLPTAEDRARFLEGSCSVTS